MQPDRLTATIARERLNYNPSTGALIWRAPERRSDRLGKPVGYIQKTGYLAVYIGGKLRTAHRVIWLMVTGEWPKGQIDHIDGNKLNNAVHNLRDVDAATNVANRHGPRRDSKTGVIGVTKKGCRFFAYINRGGKKYSLGGYSSLEDASAARQQFQQENNHAD